MLREEIKEGIKGIVLPSGEQSIITPYMSDIVTQLIIEYLHSMNVVIKEDGELPKYYCGYVDYEKDADGEMDMSKPVFHDLYNKFNENQKMALAKAGYTKTSPLIGGIDAAQRG